MTGLRPLVASLVLVSTIACSPSRLHAAPPWLESHFRPMVREGFYPMAVERTGDGRLDLLMSESAGIVQYNGNGDGTFQPGVVIASFSGKTAWTMAEINGDARPDIIANRQGAMSIYYQLSDGSFTLVKNLFPDGAPWSLAAADLNGDGFIDLVSVDRTVDKLTVFLSGGYGGFFPYVSYLTPDTPWHVVVADVTCDGKPDVIVASRESHSVSVYPGNGDGTLGARLDRATGYRPVWVAVGDFDGSGFPDIAAVSSDQSVVSTFVCSPGGIGPRVDVPAGQNPTGAVLEDVIGGPALDLVTSDGYGHTISVREGVGNGSFAAQFTAYPASHYPDYALVADWTGDGREDLGFMDANDFVFAVLPARPDGGFGNSRNVSVGTASLRGATTTDIDGDGHLDLLSPRGFPGDVVMCFGDGTGGFSSPTGLTTGEGSYELLTVDIDADADIDVVARVTNPNVVAVYLNQGGRQFAPAVTLSGLLGEDAIAVADLDEDGLCDVVGVYRTAGQLGWWKNLGGGSFGAVQTIPGIVPASWLDAGDLDEDGHLDLVAPCGNGNDLRILRGHGDGQFDAPSIIQLPNDQSLNDLMVRDLNGDGHLDVTIAWNAIWLMYGRGDGTFEPTVTLSTVPNITGLDASDIDGDGNLDLAVASRRHCTVGVYRGHGDGTFEVGILHGTPSPWGVAVGDFDEDGLLDAATASSALQRLEILLNVLAPVTGVPMDAPTNGVTLLRVLTNPAFRGATFEFTAPGPGRLVVRLFDPVGRPVATLHNNDVDAGPQRIRWNGQLESGGMAPPGTYFARATFGRHVATRTLTWLGQ